MITVKLLLSGYIHCVFPPALFFQTLSSRYVPWTAIPPRSSSGRLWNRRAPTKSCWKNYTWVPHCVYVNLFTTACSWAQVVRSGYSTRNAYSTDRQTCTLFKCSPCRKTFTFTTTLRFPGIRCKPACMCNAVKRMGRWRLTRVCSIYLSVPSTQTLPDVEWVQLTWLREKTTE